MSYHCPDWTNNLTGHSPSRTFEDGIDWDELYREAQCGAFSMGGWFQYDQDGDLLDSGDNGETPDCDEHGRTADWNTPDISDSLNGAGFTTCDDCEQVYHTIPAYEDHRNEAHGEDDEDEDRETIAAAARRRAAPHGIRSTHNSWVST